MSKKIAKVLAITWQRIDDVLCAIYTGRDSVRREISVAVPAASFQSLAAEARRRIAAAQAKGEYVLLPPPWLSVNFLTVQTMNVGTTDTQTVGVIFDRGLETEYGLSLPIGHAHALGLQLVAEAEKIRANPILPN
jgi:hypothetical protein